MECPEKAAEYDRQHQEAAEAPRWGPKHSGAVELAGQYTKGSCGHLQCGLFVSKLVLELVFAPLGKRRLEIMSVSISAVFNLIQIILLSTNFRLSYTPAILLCGSE